MGAEQLGPAVRVPGVGVHHASGQLYQLADVPHQQHLAEGVGGGQVQGVADEVGDLHHRRAAQGVLPEEFLPVIPRGEDHVPRPQGRGLVQLQGDGVHQGLLAHGLHNARGTQDGQPALHPQGGVESLLGRLPAPGDGEGDLQPAGVARLCAHCPGLGLDHLPGHPVDGRRAHRLVQAGLCHPAHPLAPVDAHPGTGALLHPGHHHQAVGGVGVVAAVLPHPAHRGGPLIAEPLRGGLYRQTLGGHQGQALRRLPQQ